MEEPRALRSQTFTIGYPPLTFGPSFDSFDDAIGFLKWLCYDRELRIQEVNEAHFLVHDDHVVDTLHRLHDHQGEVNMWLDAHIARYSPMHIYIQNGGLKPAVKGLILIAIGGGWCKWCVWTRADGLRECANQSNPDAQLTVPISGTILPMEYHKLHCY